MYATNPTRLLSLILLLLPITGLAQDANLQKYWQYRKRFNDHFIVRGIEDGANCDFYKGGYSIPFENLCIGNEYENKDANGNVINKGTIYSTIGKADNPEKLGWYLAVLATEYKLLKDAGEDVSDLLLEIYQALKAYERLDWKAEGNYPSFPSSTCSYDGRALRDDANHGFFKEAYPKVFKSNPNYATRSNTALASQMQDEVNSVLSINPLNNFVKDAKTTIPPASNANNLIFSEFYKSDYYEYGRDETDQRKMYNIMSKDHMVWMFMGFALMRKYMTDVVYIDPSGTSHNLVNMVQGYTNNFINAVSAHTDKSPFPPGGSPLSSGWFISDPITAGQMLCDEQEPSGSGKFDCLEKASDMRSLSVGFDIAAQYISGNRKCQEFSCAPYDALGWRTVAPMYIPNSSRDFDFIRDYYDGPAKAALSIVGGLAVGLALGPITGSLTLPINTILTNVVLSEVFNRNSAKFFTQENHAMIFALAAIGDSWVGPNMYQDFGGNPAFLSHPFAPGIDLANNNTAQILSYVTSKTNTYIFALLHKALHDSNLNLNGLGNFDDNRVLLDIAGAPQCGTQFHVGSHSNPSDPDYNPDFEGFQGWYGQNRWIRSRQANCIDPTSDKGLFNGLDFMLLYNLYRLTYGGGSTNYSNMLDSKTRLSYPYLDGSRAGGSGGIGNLVKASIQQPENLVALNTIESQATISYIDLFDCGVRPRDGSTVPPCSTIVRYWGDETFSATENIKLTNGFKVKSGANFHAKIDGNIGCNSYVGGNGHSCSKTLRVADNDINIEEQLSSNNSQLNSQTLPISKNESISIFPNPANNTLTIQYNLSENQSLQWSLTRMDGAELFGESNNASQEGDYQKKLDISNLSSGMYFIKCNISGKSFIYKFIKEE